MGQLISTREAAKQLAVGPTSVKRWADEGLLPCVKTAGGHRRFDADEVDRFRRSMTADERPKSVRGDPIHDWIELLVASRNGVAVQAELLQARATGGGWWHVATLISEVLAELGRQWARGERTIVEEHVASDRLYRAITSLGAQIPVAPTAPKCAFVVADGDIHTLGLSLAELIGREAGWQTVWLGASTPLEDIVGLVESGTIEALIVSASSFSDNEQRLAETAATFGEVCARRRVELVLGGSGSWPEDPAVGRRIRSFYELRRVLVQAIESPRARNGLSVAAKAV